jgi:outer membrane protein OmpA-like peptidoglycan-associated protein
MRTLLRSVVVSLPTIALLTSVLLVSCATDDPNRRAKRGAAIGAIAGAVIGHQIDHDVGSVVGGAIGAIAGGSVGNYQDNQHRELEAALEEERRNEQIEIQRLQDDTLKVSLSSEASFDFDKSALKPAFYPALNKLANLFSKYDRTLLHVIGYTDSVGTDAYNINLSNERAISVAFYLNDQGVDMSRIRTEGRGESEPRMLNDTAANRALNRRVEIYIRPIIEGREQQALEAPV